MHLEHFTNDTFVFVPIHTRADRPLSLWQDSPAANVNQILTKQQREMQKYNPILNIDIYERVSTLVSNLLFTPILIHLPHFTFLSPLGQLVPALRRFAWCRGQRFGKYTQI